MEKSPIVVLLNGVVSRSANGAGRIVNIAVAESAYAGLLGTAALADRALVFPHMRSRSFPA